MTTPERVGMLHGYGQTAASFKSKSSAIRKHFRGKNYKLVYLEGPHKVTNFKGEPGKAWWTTEGEEDFFTSTEYKGVEESIALIKKQAPFKKFVGFSQGAAFASFLAAYFQVDLVILIGGFPVSDLRYRGLYDQITVKSVHVYGTADEVVLPARSQELYELLKGEKQLIVHPGRHVVPNATASMKYSIPSATAISSLIETLLPSGEIVLETLVEHSTLWNDESGDDQPDDEEIYAKH